MQTAQGRSGGAPRARNRARLLIGSAGAAIMGAAPHVLHHVGPLAGAALLAGTTGRVLFGAVGFLLAAPMLRKLHRHTGSWVAPLGALVLMALAFAFSSFVVAPALTDSDGRSPTPRSSPDTSEDAAPAVPTASGEHDGHHPESGR